MFKNRRDHHFKNTNTKVTIAFYTNSDNGENDFQRTYCLRVFFLFKFIFSVLSCVHVPQHSTSVQTFVQIVKVP